MIVNEEVNALLNYIDDPIHSKIQSIDFYQGTLNSKEVVVFQSGIGLVMAAMSLTICLDHFKITHLINIGTAGGLDPHQQVLDLVIPEILTYHDFDISAFGNERNFSAKNRFIYRADKSMIEDIKPLLTHEKVWYGPLVSGNQFISTSQQVEQIRAHYPQAVACEMEGAALANVASVFNIPFIIIRSLSDIVLHPSNEMTFAEYLEKASSRSAKLCHDFVELIKL